MACNALAEKSLSAAALSVAAVIVVWYFAFMRPDSNLEWEPEHGRMPAVTFDAAVSALLMSVTSIGNLRRTSSRSTSIAFMT